jgi:hypothetical protein
MAQTAKIHHLFLCELPQVGAPFFTALAVYAMVVRPWHIAAGTMPSLSKHPLNLEIRFLHRWMRY